MNIREALESAGVEVKDGSNEDELWICCPFCIEEGEPDLDDRFRLGINIRSGKAHCFNCNKSAHGEDNGWDRDYIAHELQRVLETGEIELQQERRRKKKKHKEKVTLPDGYEQLVHPDSSTDEWNNKAWRYVRKRGVTEAQIRDKKIGFSMFGDLHHRVIFPVYRHGKLKGLVGRAITDTQEPKYLNSVGNKTIYNLPDSTHHKAICLFEGVFDTLVTERPARKLGIDTGGVLGHTVKDDQWELLEKYPTILVWFDPDKAGIQGLCKVFKSLPPGKIMKAVLPLTFRKGLRDYDPSELERKVIEKRLLSAVKFTDTLHDELRAWMAFED